MRLALIADIHSNHVALEACLDYIDHHRIDGLVFLGDYVSDCPYPQKTIHLLRTRTEKYKVWFIRGNREDYLIRHHRHPDDGWKYSSSSGSLLYTYENLTEEDLLFFESLPISARIEISGFPPITACHGSPGNSQEMLHANTKNADMSLQAIDTDYLACAHSHNPFKYNAFGRVLINCGSVGASTNGQTKAQFVVLEYSNGLWKEEFISQEYDTDRILADFGPSGLNDKAFCWARSMAMVLRTGEDYNMICLKRAIELARQQEDAVDTRDIPEKYWQQAAQELGII